MTTPGHSSMAQPWKEAKNKEFHAPLEGQAKKNHYFGGKDTREAEELSPGDSPVVANEGGDSPPSNLHDRAVGGAIAKMLDKYKGGMERPLLTKRRKLIMEANARLETITQKHGDGYRKGQEPMEKLYDKLEARCTKIRAREGLPSPGCQHWLPSGTHAASLLWPSAGTRDPGWLPSGPASSGRTSEMMSRRRPV